MILLALALAVSHPAHHRCHISRRVSDVVRGDLTPAQMQALYDYGSCVCGWQGWNDYSIPKPNPPGEFYERLNRFRPSCERDGWNGHRYAPR
jgi:hypothetical protein